MSTKYFFDGSTIPNLSPLTMFKLWSNVALLPLEVNVEEQRFSFTRNQGKLMIWKITFLVEFLLFLFVCSTMLLTLTDPEYFKIQNVGIHYTKVIVHCVSLFCSYQCFIRNPELSVSVLNEIQAGGPKQGRQKLTLQKILLVTQPWMCQAMWIFIAALLATDCSRPMILYFAISQGDGNCWRDVTWTTYGLFSLFELFILHRFTVLSLCLHMHLQAFERWNDGLDTKLDNIRRSVNACASPGVKLYDWYMQCRKLQLLLAQFNLVNKFIVLGLKQMFLTNLIVCASAAIARFEDHVPSGLVHSLLAVYALIFFPVVYDKAFCIPMKIEDLKSNIIAAASASQDLKLMKRCIGSIRVTGVQVGNFHVMERASTLNFIDFAGNSVTSLLLSFRLM